MKKIETELPGVVVLEPATYRDARGFFLESYNQRVFAELGIHTTFVQDNHSGSARGTLRGLHYQFRNQQAKLCRVVAGEVLDVAVDIRLGSPNFGRSVAVVLSAENRREIYIPAGFAHGFVTLSDTAEFLYKCSNFYDPNSERGICWNDPKLAIPWGIEHPVMSEKDQRHPNLAAVPESELPRYEAASDN